MRRRRTPPGSPPGTLVADAAAPRPRLRVIAYGPDRFEETEPRNVEALAGVVGHWPVTWVDVQGLGDVETVRALGDRFDLHGLALEDVINVHQRPKVELYENHVFIVTRMVGGPATDGGGADTEQVAMFLGADFLLTFQERSGDCFEPVRERLRHAGGRIRAARADYLAYTLIDAVIDGYFPVLEGYGERVERLEDAVTARPDAALVAQIHALKRDLLTLRRAIWPQREMVNALIRDESSLVAEPTRLYLRDCYDHAIQLMDMIETYREIASGLVDLHLSSFSARLNETIIATIFIPLSFITGLYGMNFDPSASRWNMPELGWRYGYPFALGLMGVVAIGLLVYFRRKGWIGGRDRRSNGP
jgi:magnesium transporter